MSYILQALQRAEAERNRGATPGLNTPVLPAVAEPAVEPRRALPWALAGGAVVGCAALAWWLWPEQAPREAVAPIAAAPMAPATPPAASTTTPAPALPQLEAQTASPVAQAVPPAPIVAAPPVAAPAPAPAPAVTPSAPSPRAPVATPVPPAATARATPPAQAPATVPAAPAAPPATAAPSPAPVATLAELPPQLRQALPPLNLGGGIYSAEPANRLLIVNGQVLREKAQIAPDLILESIGPRAAVFKFRQQRFEMKY